MNVAKELITQILRSGDLQPYLDAGFDETFLKSQQGRSFILNSSKVDDWRIYEYLLAHHAKHGCPPSMELFGREYPAWRLSDQTYKPSEITEQVHIIVQRHCVTHLINDAAEWLENDSFDEVPALLREHADRLAQTSSGPGRGILPEIYDEDGLSTIPDPEPLILDVLDTGTLVYLVAESNKGKSFLALDWAAHIANGEEWQGHTTWKTEVLYIAGEAVSGMKRRAAAWSQHNHGRTHVDFMAGPAQIPDSDQMARLSKIINDRGYGLVIFDTQHTCAQGLDENSEQDMGKMISGLRKLMEASPGLTVLVVHHMGKDTTRGQRGSSAIKADCDDMYEIIASDPHVVMNLKVSKRKDGESIDEMPLKLRKIRLPMGRTSCVIDKPEDDEVLIGIVRTITDADGDVSVKQMHAKARAAGYSGNREDFTAELEILAENGRVDKTMGPRGAIYYRTI